MKFRKGVGAVILNKDNQIFFANRIDLPTQWQMPQGGVDGEEPTKVALRRELKEETGITKIEILDCIKGLTYILPKESQRRFWNGKYVGQKQDWFFVKFMGSEKDINLNYHHTPEFKQYTWVDCEYIINNIVDFKKDMYTKIFKYAKEKDLI